MADDEEREYRLGGKKVNTFRIPEDLKSPEKEALEELTRLARLPDDELRDYVDQILLESMRTEKRSARLRTLMIVCGMVISWILGAACAAQALAQ